ncbi:MAG: hypothetical protein KJ833_10895, partial [Alphaproteobacteria bacterium]|nr:hypothetical protein [Alphaproteobacteria bacterium]
MWSIARLRRHPHFADHFAHVHPLCWLILWWQLNNLIRWYDTARPEGVLYSISEWGFITVRYIAPRPDPAAYRPIPRTFRPLTDARWGSDLPACLGQETPCALILPRKIEGSGSASRGGAG